MGPNLVAAVTEALFERGPDVHAIEQIRELLGLSALSLELDAMGPAAPATPAEPTWSWPLVWQRVSLGWLVGRGPRDEAALATVAPLVASALVQQREKERSDARVRDVEQRATRALDLAELVTWLLHARDQEEVEQLGTSAISTLLGVEAGGLCVRNPTGGWQLKVPVRQVLERSFSLEASKLRRIVDRELVEYEFTFDEQPDDPLVHVLGPHGYRYAFCVPLDSGQEPQGVVMALSEKPLRLDTEGRVAAAQLSVMISVALDRLADQDRIAAHRKSLADALRAASMGTWEVELATRRTTWSRELSQLMGGGFSERVMGPEELGSLVGDAAAPLLSLPDLPKRFADGKAEPFVGMTRTLDGRTIWLRHLAEVVVDHDGKPVRIRGVSRDVTHEVLTQRELKASQEQLQQASAMAHIGAWDYDLASGAVTWSDEVRHIFGVGPDFVPTNDPRAFYDEEQWAPLHRAHLACVKHGTPYDVEVEVKRADGRRVWARHLCNAERVNGRTVRLFGAVQDVTEQHRAREEALTASRIKSQFLANTSHEIRTPLNGIIGMTELLLQTALAADQRENLEAVHASGQNLLAIVNDILDISKIESGHLSLEAIPFSLVDRVFEAVRGQASRAHAKGLELVVDLAPAVTQVVGDPVRVGQIVTNLVGNAVKFTESGEVAVRVDLADGVHIAVSDTGIGIPENRIDAIFEAFTQADGSTSRRFGGTGLGLTITLELVKAMGGRIEVDSEPGRGSTFHVWLPLAVAPMPRLAASDAGPRVLLVAGNPRSEAVTRAQLEQLGCRVVVSSADAAMHSLLQAVETHPFELLVAEQELDGTSGLELADALGFDERLSKLPRVLTVRTLGRPTSAQLAAAGVERVLTRPVAPREFASLLSELSPGGGFKPRASTTNPAHQSRPLQVLLAEDNAINARLARGLLEKLGHTVTHVINGALAVEAAAKGGWDAVLMDMQMPVLDGLDATREIRKAEQRTGAHLPIIALTANAMKGDDQICLDAGMDAYLTKPIDLAALTRALESLTAEVRGKTA